jgi:crotonobetainyl-CoA:carnitine CoA-transferase CaiB-like acyl-CoA transferase
MSLLSTRAALEGLRILDLTSEKGSFCGKLLADMGADVIKVEPPGGDPARRLGPFLNDAPNAEASLSFWYNNTSKRGITLNLEHGEGQKVFRELARSADVVVEAFPPGYLKKLSLDYEVLKDLNPRLIMTSITNFGQTGPYKDYASCDLVALALGEIGRASCRERV